MIDSRISGFYRMTIDERLDELLQRGIIDAETAKRLKNSKGLLSRDIADRMVENVIGVFGLPLAVAPNFRVNGKDYIVPMVIEEPSVVAGVSAAAMLVRNSGGFTTTSSDPVASVRYTLTTYRTSMQQSQDLPLPKRNWSHRQTGCSRVWWREVAAPSASRSADCS